MAPNPTRLVAALNKMFATLPLPNSSADPREAFKVYAEVSQPFSTEDVEMTVQQFLAGTVAGFNPNFAPTAPKFASQLRANAEYRASLTSSRNMLIEQFREQERDEEWQQARTPEAKAKVQSMLDGIQAKADQRPPEAAAKAKALLDHHDRVFSNDFYQVEGGTVISAGLANQLHRLGYATFNAADDEAHDMGQARSA